MNGLLVWLVPVALAMGIAGLVAFLWAMKNGQLEDLDGAGERVLHQPVDAPLRAESMGADPKSSRRGDGDEPNHR